MVLEDHMTVVFLCIIQDTYPTKFSMVLFEKKCFLKTNGKNAFFTFQFYLDDEQ